MNCEHLKKQSQELVRKIGRQEFKYVADTCSGCGATLWDTKLDEEFRKWLSEQDQSLFMVQEIRVPGDVYSYLQSLSFELTGKESVSACVKAMTTVYCDYVLKDRKLNSNVEKEFEQKQELVSAETKEINVRLLPYVYVRIKAQADMADMSMGRFMSECVMRISCALMDDSAFEGRQDFISMVESHVRVAA